MARKPQRGRTVRRSRHPTKLFGWTMGGSIVLLLGLLLVVIQQRSAASAATPAQTNQLQTNLPQTVGFGFAGERHNPDGTLHLRARTYNPAPQVGRFVQRDNLDTAVLAMAQPVGANRGGPYANNNPVNLTDPSGNNPLDMLRRWNETPDQRQKREASERQRKEAEEREKKRRHLERNQYNHCWDAPPELMDGTYYDPNGNIWNVDPQWAVDRYHDYEGNHKRNRPNIGFRNNNAYKGSQCIYDYDGNLINSGPSLGTYDFHPGGTPQHYMEDVQPHEKYNEKDGCEYLPTPPQNIMRVPRFWTRKPQR